MRPGPDELPSDTLLAVQTPDDLRRRAEAAEAALLASEATIERLNAELQHALAHRDMARLALRRHIVQAGQDRKRWLEASPPTGPAQKIDHAMRTGAAKVLTHPALARLARALPQRLQHALRQRLRAGDKRGG